MKLSKNRLSSLASLSTAKGRREKNAFLASGVRVISEAIRADWLIECLVVSRSNLTATGEEFIKNTSGIDVYDVSTADMKRLDASKSSQGIVAVLSKRSLRMNAAKLKSRFVLALDDISDPSNLGAILRSALAFGFRDVILSAETVDPYSPKVVRASTGSLFHLKVYADIDLLAAVTQLKTLGYQLIGTGSDGEPLLDRTPAPDSICLAIGNEAHGMTPQVTAMCDQIIGIPIAENCESLSAPVAAGIMMFELSRSYRMSNQPKPGTGDTVIRK
jgi:TrmH family RNA methyltransferase